MPVFGQVIVHFQRQRQLQIGQACAVIALNIHQNIRHIAESDLRQGERNFLGLGDFVLFRGMRLYNKEVGACAAARQNQNKRGHRDHQDLLAQQLFQQAGLERGFAAPSGFSCASLRLPGALSLSFFAIA